MYSATFKGQMLSFGNCEIKIAGARQVGIPKADMSCGLKAEGERGTGPIMLGSALGNHEATFSMDQHLQEAVALQALLDDRSGGAGFALAEVNVSFTFNGAGVRINGFVAPIQRVEIKDVRFLDLKPSLSNDGKSIVGSWTTLVTQPIAWTVGGRTIYSINPDVFATSNSISIGIGGTIQIAG
jgi:hypothetical protein